MQGLWGSPPPGLPGVLAYHKVGTVELGGTWCGAAQFSSHLEALQSADYQTVGTADFQAALAALGSTGSPQGDQPQPSPRCSEAPASRSKQRRVLLTFDDAFESFAETAWPALAQRRMQALLFVVTDFVGRSATWDLPLPGRRVRHLSWSALRELVDAGVEIGCHSARHVDLRRLSSLRLAQELEHSRRTLEDQLGIGIRAFSWPFGRWNRACCEAARQSGYQLGFAMSPQGRNDQINDMAIPRRGVYVTDSGAAVLDKLDAARAGFWFQDLFTRGVGAVASLSTHFQKEG